MAIIPYFAICVLYLASALVDGQSRPNPVQLRQLYRAQQMARNQARNQGTNLRNPYNPANMPRKPPFRLPTSPVKYYRKPVAKPQSAKSVQLIPSSDSVPSCIEAISAAIQATPYVDALFYSTNGSLSHLESPLDSVCSFEGPCTWNVFPAGVGKQVKNKLHPSIISYCFEVAEVPSGEFLLFTSAAQDKKETTARFVSSTIGCSKSKISVNFKHWATPKVALQVCLRETNNLMWHCVNVPGASGLSTAVLAQPEGSFNVVILARNFGIQSKAAMLLDDVSVDFVPCDVKESESTQIVEEIEEELAELEELEEEEGEIPLDATLLNPELQSSLDNVLDKESIEALSQRLGLSIPISEEDKNHYLEETLGDFDLGLGSADECSAIECDFEMGEMCSYTSSSTPGTDGFALQAGRYKNRITGILGASEGEMYAAAYLRAGQETEMSVNVLFPEDRVIRFYAFDSTESLQLKACCSTKDDCPYESPLHAEDGARSWHKASFMCPQGTEKILFVCTNPENSQHQGACGVDKITLLVADEGFSAEEAVIPACGGDRNTNWTN